MLLSLMCYLHAKFKILVILTFFLSHYNSLVQKCSCFYVLKTEVSFLWNKICAAMVVLSKRQHRCFNN